MTTKASTQKKKPDFKIMCEYGKHDGSTGLREIGVLWNWKKNDNEGMSGHLNQQIPEGTKIVLFQEKQ